MKTAAVNKIPADGMGAADGAAQGGTLLDMAWRGCL